ncbi:MAG: hypothetical protein ACLRWQ_18675 [Flavonifractor plautii]
MGHSPTQATFHSQVERLVDEWLEEQAPGRFKVEVYPNGQLGDSPDMVAGVKLELSPLEFDLSSVVVRHRDPRLAR